MAKLSEKLKFNILQKLSGNFYIDYIPDEWNELSESEQDEWLGKNTWEPFEYHDPNQVWGWCTQAADAIISGIEYGNLNLVEEE
jgi:hypothetical protein